MRNRYEIDVIIIDSDAWAPTFDQPVIEGPQGIWEPDWSKPATLRAKVKSIDYIGNLEVEFNEIVAEAMYDNVTWINETVLELKMVPSLVNDKTNMSRFNLTWEAVEFIE